LSLIISTDDKLVVSAHGSLEETAHFRAEGVSESQRKFKDKVGLYNRRGSSGASLDASETFLRVNLQFKA